MERQNHQLDKLDKALGNLHHVSKAVGDELEEQITFSFVIHFTNSLIEQLEDQTERAQSSSRKLHRNLKVNALQRERQSILLLDSFILANSLLNIVLILALILVILILIYVWNH